MEVEQADAGGIIALAGLEGIAIGETLADPLEPVALPTIKVEEPSVRMTFGVNTSPFTGREGKWSTSRKLRERLFSELRTNVSLRVQETESAETFLVSGRGELHLAILIETMRREGYEVQVSRPEVILHTAEDGAMLEPYEEVHVETSPEKVGSVVELLGARRGKMLDMQDSGYGSVRLVYLVPTRGLLGFRYQFLTATRGMGALHTLFSGYDDMSGPMGMVKLFVRTGVDGIDDDVLLRMCSYLEVDPRIGAGLLAYLVALLTVSYQAFKAARTEPVKALKYE